MNKKEEIFKLKQILMEKIKSENDSRYTGLSSDDIMKIIDSSGLSGKYSLWICREYIKDNIQRFEDMGRVKQALILFKNNLSKFTEQQKQLNKISFQELETLVLPYQDVLTQNAVKRMNKEKIWSEIEVVYEGVEGRIYIPKTKEASVFLGQGTKWCTASINNNMFAHYNSYGPLYVFVLPDKDEEGRAIKYQLHFKTEQFMDIKDETYSMRKFNNETSLLNILYKNLDLNDKIKYFVKSDIFLKLFYKMPDISNYIEEIITEKSKLYGLDSVPKALRTQELCEKMVKQNGYDLKFVPDKFITDDLCKIAIKQNTTLGGTVPKRFKTIDFYKFLVTLDEYALRNMPTRMKTEEMCKISVKNYGHTLSEVPHKLKTKELCEIAVRQNGGFLYYVPEDMRTQELCELAVKQSEIAIANVPHKLESYELCKMAVLSKPDALRYVPQKFVTKELCELAIKLGGNALSHVPSEFKTPELCEIAVSFNADALYHVPEEFKTKELCELAIKKDGDSLFYVPKNLVTKELCILALSTNGNAIKYIPKNFINNELCRMAIEQDSLVFKYIPVEFKTPELCLFALRQNNKNFFSLPDDMKTIKTFEFVVDEFLMKNNLKYSFGEAVKMIFDFEDNPLKNYFEDVKSPLEDFYSDMIIEEIIKKINNNHKISLSI